MDDICFVKALYRLLTLAAEELIMSLDTFCEKTDEAISNAVMKQRCIALTR